nr:Chain A, Protegrin-4 [Sus scrofa]
RGGRLCYCRGWICFCVGR